MSDSMQDANARLGIRLFFIYAAYYFAYVLVNAFAAHWAEWKPIAGLNLAILWGFSLIGFAFLMALVYGYICNLNDKAVSEERVGSEEVKS